MNLLRYAKAAYNAVAKPERVWGKPVHVNIEPTTVCNYACVMCRRELVAPGRHMSLLMFTRILDELQPLKLSLNGYGETFANPEIFAMLAEAGRRRIGTVTTTNGSLLCRDVEQLRDAALSVLRVSLDAATPPTYAKIRCTDRFAEVVSGVGALAQAWRLSARSPTIRLEFVILEDNYRELPEFVTLAGRLGVRHLFFQIYSEKELQKKLALVGGINYPELAAKVAEGRVRANRLRIRHNLDFIAARLAVMQQIYQGEPPARAPGRVCINPWLTLYVTVDGEVWPCCRFGYRDIVAGDLRRQSFADVWNGESFTRLRRGLKDGKNLNYMCRTCEMPSLTDMLRMRFNLLPRF